MAKYKAISRKLMAEFYKKTWWYEAGNYYWWKGTPSDA